MVVREAQVVASIRDVALSALQLGSRPDELKTLLALR